MGAIGRAMASVEQRGGRSYFGDLAAPEEPGLLGRLLSSAKTLFDVFETGDEWARALAGRVLGSEGTGQETPFGRAPSGEELNRALGIEVGPNVPGQIEWRDVPGFTTELLASPWNLLGLGALTKIGKLASKAAKLSGRLAALQKSGRIAVEAGAAREAADLTGRLAQLGQVGARGATLAEQGALGQRSLLSLDIPGLLNVPLGGRTLNRLALAPFTAAGRLTRPLTSAIANRYLRVGGRIEPRQLVQRPGLRATGQEFNELISAVEDAARGGVAAGLEQRQLVRQAMGAAQPEAARQALGRLGTRLPALSQRVLATDRPLLRLAERLERAQAAGNAGRVSRLTRQISERTEDLSRRFGQLPRTDVRDPITAAMDVAVEKLTVAGKHEQAARVLRGAYATEINRLLEPFLPGHLPVTAENVEGRVPELFQIVGDRNTADARLADRVSEIQGRFSARLAETAAKGQLAESVVRAMPTDILREARRIDLVHSGAAAQEIKAGVPLTPLGDEDLTYLGRIPTSAGIRFHRELQGVPVDNPIARRIRNFQPAGAFTKRRDQIWNAMPVTLVNDEVNRAAQALRAQGYKISFGARGFEQFFVEDVGESLVRRLAAGGRARQAAHLHTGVATMFSVPKSARQAGDMALSEYLAKAGLGRFAGMDLARSEQGLRRLLRGTNWADKYVPREFAEAALKTHSILRDPDEVAGVTQFLGRYAQLLRFYVTAPFPAYHLRNATTNAFMMWLAGVRNPIWFARAFQTERNARRALLDAGNAAPNMLRDLETVRTAQRLGSMGAQQTGELETLTRMAGSLRPTIGGRAVRGLGGLAAPTQTAVGGRLIRFGTGLENNAKLALFLEGRARGLSDIEAAERVKKFLFDYSALSPFEKRYLRRWAYFYTFTRKSIPLMFQQFVESPRTMRALGIASGQVGADSLQERSLAEYERSRNPMFIGRWRGRERFADLGLPINDLFLLSAEGRPGLTGLSRIGQRLLGQVAPPLRGPLEFVTGMSLDTGQPTAVSQEVRAMKPWGRFESTGRLIADVARGKRPAFDLARLAGIGTFSAEGRRGSVRRQLLATNAALEELVAQGRARKFPVYAKLEGETSPEIDRLNRARKRLLDRLGG